jgi:hypothetical protein
MEAGIDLVGGDGNDASGLDREIDRLIVLLAGDEERAVVQSVVFTLLGLGPAAFGQLTEAIYTTEDGQLRLRTIEVMGLSSQSRHGTIPILIAAWIARRPDRPGGDPEGALCPAADPVLAVWQLPARAGASGSEGVATGRVIAGVEDHDGGQLPAIRRCGRLVMVGLATTIADREEVMPRLVGVRVPWGPGRLKAAGWRGIKVGNCIQGTIPEPVWHGSRMRRCCRTEASRTRPRL